MRADVKDVDELLEMIRSTALTDYIRFDLNGDGDTNDTVDGQPESQPLQLINPAGVFKKYCMTDTIPSAIGLDETIDLSKEWYKGLIFEIPGAEVLIDGQWIAYDAKNEDLILAQNPMNLEWRLNGNLLSEYGYKLGDTVSGQLVAVDDEWNGLSLTKDISFTFDNASGISTPVQDASAETLYTIDGHRLNAKPTKPGIYIVNGQKVTVK